MSQKDEDRKFLDQARREKEYRTTVALQRAANQAAVRKANRISSRPTHSSAVEAARALSDMRYLSPVLREAEAKKAKGE